MIINVTSPIIIMKISKIIFYVHNNIKNISESFDIVIVFLGLWLGFLIMIFSIHSKIQKYVM